MKQIFLILTAALLPLSALAVDPTPNKDRKEKVESVQKSGGALKVEKKPAVPPEALKNDAVPAPQAAPAPAEETPAFKESRSSGEHFFGLHAAVGLPHPINYGLIYVHSSRLFSADFGTGSYKFTVDGVNAKIDNTEVALRWHPWAGSFFLGAAVGN
ncbi:MAG: hypothetical protein KF802_07200 [Bdellovibrionaceae bacterium]|nr:hypothetical protein [Pseudobdellovibrionaceae bacterium]